MAAPWLVFADTLLAAAALRFRIDRGEPPRDFAGVVVADDEIDHLLAELPGLRGGGDRGVSEDPLATARSASQGPWSAGDDLFGSVVRMLRLEDADVEVLAVLCAIELDLARQTVVAYMNDNVSMRHATIGVLRRMFPHPHPGPGAVAGDSPLRTSGLVSVDGAGPWASQVAGAAPTLAWALDGDRSLDPDLPRRARLVTSTVDSGRHGVVFVTGGDPASRRAAAVRHMEASAVLVTPTPASPAEWDAVVRQATIAGTGLLVEVDATAQWTARAAAAIERTPHLSWGISSHRELPVEDLPERPYHEIAVDGGTEEQRGDHLLDAEQARLVDLTAAGRAGDWDAAVRRLSGGHLDELAVRVRPRRGWDDLVLDPEQLDQVRELVARYRGRQTVYGEWSFPPVPSSGITALFSGPSGTGKTLSAEVVAAELGLDLYRIDLSTVVSKYIGETEKNLERIFTAATAGNVVLFFDEADALFGKRSSVGDAHDRYANIEVSYLLQRLEQYDGIVVLATNLRKNIDDAFLRRIDVAIEYELPGPDQRRDIWTRSFPVQAPLGDIDYEFLAQRFDIAGGTITNAALAAAFAAADDGTAIGMEHVILGLKREFQKLGRLRTESEFDRYLDLVNGGQHAASAR